MTDTSIDLYPLNFLGFHDFDGTVAFWLDKQPSVVITVAMTLAGGNERSVRLRCSADGWHSPPPTKRYSRLVILHEVPPTPGPAVIDNYLKAPPLTLHYTVDVVKGAGVQSYGQVADASGTLLAHLLRGAKKAELAASFKVAPYVRQSRPAAGLVARGSAGRPFPPLNRSFVAYPIGSKPFTAQSANVGDVVAVTSAVRALSLADIVWTWERSSIQEK